MLGYVNMCASTMAEKMTMPMATHVEAVGGGMHARLGCVMN